MENNKTNGKQKRNNPMKKIGQSIKDTFIEMSNSLAGWIDDTGTQFSGKKSRQKKTKNAPVASLNKTSTASSDSAHKTNS